MNKKIINFVTILLGLSIMLFNGCQAGVTDKEKNSGHAENEKKVDNDQILFSNSEESLPPYYYQYLMIFEKQKNRYLTIESENNVYGNGIYYGYDNQQWLIMPVCPGSTVNYIVSKYNAGVLDIHSSWNIYVYDNYPHKDNNQLFRYKEISDSLYIFESPYASGVFDISNSNKDRNPFKHPSSNGDNLYYNSYNGGDNQLFYIESSGIIPAMQNQKIRKGIPELIFNIPGPSITLNDINESVPFYTNKTLIGESFIPFVLIKDSYYSRTQQLTASPYYKLIREQAWEKIKDITYTPYSSVVKQTYSVKNGVSNEQSSTTQKTIETGWSISGSAEYTNDDVKQTIGNSFSQNTKTNTTLVSTYTINSITENTETLDFTGTTKNVRLVVYQLVDIYSLKRLDGTDLIDPWTIYKQDYIKHSYYAESPMTIEKIGSLTIIKDKITETIPPSIPQNLSASIISNNSFDLNWSASTDNIRVKGYIINIDGNTYYSSTNAYSAANQTPNMTHTVKVLAYDESGNMSQYSAEIIVTTSLKPMTVWINGPSELNPSTPMEWTVDLPDDLQNYNIHYTVRRGNDTPFSWDSTSTYCSFSAYSPTPLTIKLDIAVTAPGWLPGYCTKYIRTNY